MCEVFIEREVVEREGEGDSVVLREISVCERGRFERLRVLERIQTGSKAPFTVVIRRFERDREARSIRDLITEGPPDSFTSFTRHHSFLRAVNTC